jgi:formate-dependent phosphoribosylglycinamide formyltransferase (GAR transformylase)
MGVALARAADPDEARRRAADAAARVRPVKA